MEWITQDEIGTNEEVSRSIRLRATGQETTLQVEFGCSYEMPRPLCWGALPGSLDAMGFVVEQGPDGSLEHFVPTTFFSARAIICAGKSYPGHSSAALQGDITRLLSLPGRWPMPYCADTAFPAKGTLTNPGTGELDKIRTLARVV